MVMDKRKPNRNPKHLYYMSLLNTKDWKRLRGDTLQQHPLCQMCEEQGIREIGKPYIRSAVDVHHLKPVEGVGGMYLPGEEVPEDVKAQMRERCFDPKNVIALCIPHHIEIHQQMRSHQGQAMKTMPKAEQQPQDSGLEAWVKRNTGKALQPEPPKPKKGIRKTRFGWVTKDEYEQKKQEQFDNWLKAQQRNGLQGTDATPTVDAAAED